MRFGMICDTSGATHYQRHAISANTLESLAHKMFVKNESPVHSKIPHKDKTDAINQADGSAAHVKQDLYCGLMSFLLYPLYS